MNALSRDLYRTYAEITKKSYSGKAHIYGFLAILISSLLNLGPAGLGIYWLLQGEIWKAIYVPVILYMAIGLYMAFWPVIFLFLWWKVAFLPAFIGTAVLVLFFMAPGFLMYRAMLAMQKSEEAQEVIKSMDGGSPPTP